MTGMTSSDDFDPNEDFYEDDEPLDAVLDAFERGVKGVTAPPARFELSVAPTPLVLPGPFSRASAGRVSWKAAAPSPIEVRSARIA